MWVYHINPFNTSVSMTLKPINCLNIRNSSYQCMKSVRIWSFSASYFLAFGLNTKICTVNIHIQSRSEIIYSRKTPDQDICYAVYIMRTLVLNEWKAPKAISFLCYYNLLTGCCFFPNYSSFIMRWLW